MERTIAYFAPTFFIIYMITVFVVPSVRTYRKTGIQPVTFGSQDTPHDFIGKWFKIVLGVIPVVVALYLMGRDTYQYAMPATYLEQDVIQLGGVMLCCVSFIWTAIAQYQMGVSWRIGIDEKNKTELVSSGLFSRSRNPIFFGMLVTLVGYFLMIPSGLTLAVLMSSYLLIQIQARMEEEFLAKQHGDAYRKYKLQVRRYI
jgi:protein-S-isoprenylcysteine O-methyltransferase Ste14